MTHLFRAAAWMVLVACAWTCVGCRKAGPPKAETSQWAAKWSRQLDDEDAERRKQAIAALVNLGDADAVARTSDMLANPRARIYAAFVLGCIGPEARASVPGLQAQLDTVPFTAAWALGRIAPQDPAVARSLAPLLKHRVPENCAVAAWALGRMGAPAAEATRPLEALLTSEFVVVRLRAAEALFRLGGPAEPLLPVVKASLEHALKSATGMAAISLDVNLDAYDAFHCDPMREGLLARSLGCQLLVDMGAAARPLLPDLKAMHASLDQPAESHPGLAAAAVEVMGAFLWDSGTRMPRAPQGQGRGAEFSNLNGYDSIGRVLRSLESDATAPKDIPKANP